MQSAVTHGHGQGHHTHPPLARRFERLPAPKLHSRACPIQHTVFHLFSHVYLLYCIFIVAFLRLATQMLSVALQSPAVPTAAAAVQTGDRQPGLRLRVQCGRVAGGAAPAESLCGVCTTKPPNDTSLRTRAVVRQHVTEAISTEIPMEF